MKLCLLIDNGKGEYGKLRDTLVKLLSEKSHEGTTKKQLIVGKHIGKNSECIIGLAQIVPSQQFEELLDGLLQRAPFDKATMARIVRACE
jgi:hypothetical protein